MTRYALAIFDLDGTLVDSFPWFLRHVIDGAGTKGLRAQMSRAVPSVPPSPCYISLMTRIERIAPFLEAMSDDAFEDFLAAATYAASSDTIYATLSPDEKAEIDAAIARLDANEGVPYSELKARLTAKLKASGL